MISYIILFLSIALQLTTALLSLRLIRITGQKMAWVVISAALVLMAVRRIHSLITLEESLHTALDFYETVGALTSLLMLIGILYIRRYFIDIHAAEKILSESESHFRGLYEGAPLGYQALDKNGCITEVNQAWIDTLGYSREDAIGRPFVEFLAPASAQAFPNCFALFQEKGEIHNAELELVRQDGTTLIGGFEGKLSRGPHGHDTQSQCIFVDITARKQDEETIQKLSYQNQLILDAAGEGIIGLDTEGKCIFINPAAAQLLGTEPQRTLGQQIHTLFHSKKPDGTPYPAVECPVDAAFHDGIVHSVNDEYFWREDGSGFPVEFISTPIWEHEKLAGAVLAFKDITDRKQAEDAIQAILKGTSAVGEEFFRSLVLELAAALKSRYACVGQLISSSPPRIRTVALCEDGAIARNIEYDLANTPCESVLGKSFFTFPRDVTKLFPEVRKIVKWEAESYLGVPLFSTAGEPLGLIAVLHEQPISDLELSKTLLTIFAARAASELERLQTVEALTQEAAINASMAELSAKVLMAESIQEIDDLTLELAKKLTGSELGFVGYIDPATGYLVSSTLTREIWEQCQVPQKTFVFEKFTGLWGWVLNHKKPLMTNDPAHDLRSTGAPTGHLRIHRFLSVPAVHGETLIGQIALANSNREYTERDLLTIQRLAAIYALGMRRIQAALGLRESEQFNIAIISSASEGIIVYDRELRYMVWNRFMEELTGYPAEQVLGKCALDLFPHLRAQGINLLFQRALVGEVISSQDVEYFAPGTNKSGWVSSTYGPHRNAEGQIIGVVAIVRDITDRMHIEEERREHERFLMLLNDITHAALKSPDSKSMLQTLADRLAELIHADGCYITEWDENRQAVLPVAAYGTERVTYPLVSSEPGESTMTGAVLKAGCALVAEDVFNSPYISPHIAAHFPSRSMLGLPLIAGSQRLGAALITTHQPHHFTPQEIARCEQATGLISLAIAKTRLIDETSRRAEELEVLTQVSAAMRVAQTHHQISEVILAQLIELFKAAGSALALYDALANEIVIVMGYKDWANWTGKRIPVGQGISGLVIATGKPYLNNDYQTETRRFQPDYSTKIPCAACVPLSAQEKTLGALWLGCQTPITEGQMGLFIAIADMTANAIHRQMLYEDLQTQLDALHKVQARLVQSEKLAAVGELVAGVAHELNNPLTSVVLYSQLMQQRSLDAESNRDLDKIVSEILRAAKIVRGLLDFARQRPVERKPAQINEILANSLDFVAYELRSHSIHCNLELSPNVPLTMVDPHQMQQVFVNLINNAWQAMSAEHGGGRLQVTTELGPSLFTGGQPGAPEVIRVAFRDDGPGIPHELLNRIFDPFFTTKPEGKGTGLGLSVCHGIIAEHEGHIWAESESEKGAIFLVELPIIAPKAFELLGAQELQPLDTHLTSAKILVVDDEPAVLEILARALKRQGYQVDTANDGTTALARLYKSRYDLILSDMRMPELDGPDFYREVRSKDPDLAKRIIFTTGDTLSPATRHFFEESGASYLAKPFELAELLNKVSWYLSIGKA